MTDCPCCGQYVRPPRLLVSLERNTVSLPDGSTMNLTPMLAELLAVFARRAPLPVSRSYLVEQLYGLTEPCSADSALSVHILYLRRKLRGSGISITTVRGRGYRLEVAA